MFHFSFQLALSFSISHVITKGAVLIDDDVTKLGGGCINFIDNQLAGVRDETEHPSIHTIELFLICSLIY